MIKDIIGKTIAIARLNSNTLTLDFNSYHARETYFLELIDQNNQLITVQKVVKTLVVFPKTDSIEKQLD